MILIVARSALKFWLNKLWETKQKPVFLKVILWFFKVYSIRTSWLTSKLSKSYFMDNFWFPNTPGTPGSDSLVEVSLLTHLFSIFLTNSAIWWFYRVSRWLVSTGKVDFWIFDLRYMKFETIFRKMTMLTFQNHCQHV